MSNEKKATIPSLRAIKTAGGKIRMVTAYDFAQARLVDDTEIEVILVGDSMANAVLGYPDTMPVTMDEMLHHTKAVVRGAARTLVIADLPFLSYQVSPEEAVRNGGAFLKAGASGVKLEGGRSLAPTVTRLVQAGIPVMGHLGLTPQRALELGGYKVQGRSEEDARRILDDAHELEKAGAFALVLECVPAALAAAVSEALRIPTIGIGAGAACDGQVLVFHDLLGLSFGPRPKFVKSYLNGAELAREALGRYAREVAEGAYPDEKHTYGETGKPAKQ